MTYVDDINNVANTIKEAKRLLNDLLEIMDYGRFYGDKIFASNLKLVDELNESLLDESRTIIVWG